MYLHPLCDGTVCIQNPVLIESIIIQLWHMHSTCIYKLVDKLIVVIESCLELEKCSKESESVFLV